MFMNPEMAETTGIQVFPDRYVTIDTNQFENLTDWSFSINGSPIDVTSYDSSSWKDLIKGTRSWSFSLSAYYASDATEGGDEAGADIIAGTTVAFLCTTGTQADVTWGGNAILTSFEMSNSVDGAVTISVSGEGTGALAIGAVA